VPNDAQQAPKLRVLRGVDAGMGADPLHRLDQDRIVVIIHHNRHNAAPPDPRSASRLGLYPAERRRKPSPPGSTLDSWVPRRIRNNLPFARVARAEQLRPRGGQVPAKASAEWKGDVPTGTGTFTAGETISGGYTYKSRFEDGPGSNPEQLIGAAHAACFSMALSSLLAKAGTPPESVQTEATVTIRLVDGSPTITKIALVTVGRVPGVDEAAFAEQAKAAKAGCPVSRALAGVPEITLEASLAD
jgi:lipoyl-dependent peroxiredoxin